MKSTRSDKKTVNFVFIFLAAVAVVLVLITAYVLLLAPQMAVSDYAQRLNGAKTLDFSTTVTGRGPQHYDNFDAATSGKKNATDVKNLKVDLAFNGAGDGGEFNGEARYTDETVYLKVENFGVLSLLLAIGPNDPVNWYKYKLTGSNNNTGKCLGVSGSSDSWLSTAMLKKIPLKTTGFKGLDIINGQPALHYTGAADIGKLKQAIIEANKSLSAGCQISPTIIDYKDYTVSYDIWRGWFSDRLMLTIYNSEFKTSGVITLDTNGYNKAAATIDAPAGAPNLSNLLNSKLDFVHFDTDTNNQNDNDKTNSPSSGWSDTPVNE